MGRLKAKMTVLKGKRLETHLQFFGKISSACENKEVTNIPSFREISDLKKILL